MRYDSTAVSQDRQRKDRLAAAVGAAIDFYHRILLEQPEGGRARGYLRSRGFDGDAARRFVLGWSPDGFDALSKHLQAEKHKREDIVDAGLAFVNKSNRLQDSFRSRLMFPIYDRAGVAVGFGGRSLTADGPKYKNTAETPLYHKSRLLYGLNWAKAEIGARGRGRDLRGLHGRDGVRARRHPELGGDLWHRADRAARAAAEELHPQDGARLRRGQRGAERGGEVVPVGAAVRHRGEGGRAAAGARSGRSLA